MGGGGDQTNPAQQTWQDYQQQQQYSQLGKTLQQGLQSAGSTIAGANSGLSGQVAQAPSAGTYGQPQGQPGANYAASGPLFGQPGMGSSGGVNQQQLAQILQLLGYG